MFQAKIELIDNFKGIAAKQVETIVNFFEAEWVGRSKKNSKWNLSSGWNTLMRICKMFENLTQEKELIKFSQSESVRAPVPQSMIFWLRCTISRMRFPQQGKLNYWQKQAGTKWNICRN